MTSNLNSIDTPVITLSNTLTTTGNFPLTINLTGTTTATLPSGTNTLIATPGSTGITTLGTVTTGTWSATIISPSFGGSGVNNGSNTITVGGNLNTASSFTTVGANALTLTTTGVTNATLPVGTTTLISLPGSTSITTLGTVTTGTWSATPIALSVGGTNANLTASNGGLFYSTASAGAILAGTATANQIPLSGSNTAPIWSTATYPATTTANQVLYSSANNVITGLPVTNTSVLTTSNTGVLTYLPYTSVTAGYGGTNNIVARDTNGNTSVNNITPAFNSYTSATNQTLTAASARYQIYSGAAAGITVTLPDATTLINGWVFLFQNSTAGTITIKDNSGTIIDTIPTAGFLTMYLLSNSPAAGSWDGFFSLADGPTNALIYSDGNGAPAFLPTVNSAALHTTSTGALDWIGPLTNGQIVIGSTGATPVATTVTAGTGITVTNGAGSITVGLTTPVSPANGGTGSTSVPTNGQIPIGNGTNYVAALPTAGTRITVTGGSGTLTITGNLRKNDIQGLAISFASTTTVTAATGQCRDSADSFDIVLNTTPTLNFAVNGANGLDTGAFTASNWYAVHVIADSTGVNPTALLGSLSAASPTLPAGYNKFRRIWYVRTQSGSALLINFIQTFFAVNRVNTWVDNLSFTNVLTAGSTAATFTGLSLATAVSPSANLAVLNFAYTPNLAANSFYFRPTGNATTLANTINRYSRGNGAGTVWRNNATVLTNAAQSIDYATDQAADSLTLVVYQYQDTV